MKKNLLILLLLLGTINVTAQIDAVKGVEMVEYDQSWLDYEGALSLKNNTDEPIHNVTYLIKYLDMNGTELDYAEYSTDVEINPGMTKTIQIPAFAHDRHYSYYKSEASYSHPHKFKIDFELKEYNVKSDEESILTDTFIPKADKMDIVAIIYAVVILFFCLSIGIGAYVLVAVLAKNRNRSVIIWLLLSIVFSPILIIIILLCIGNDNQDYNDYDR